MLANIGAYLFHLFTGRLLIPADYGELQSLISLSNILNVPLVTLNTVVTKFVSRFKGQGEKDSVGALYYRFRNTLFIILATCGFVFLIFSSAIVDLLHLGSWVNVIFLDFALFFGMINVLNRATLQGLSLFIELTITQFIESYGKLALGVGAVLLGWRVPGAYGGFVLIMLISYIYMIRVLSKSLGTPKSDTPIPLKAMGMYALPSFLMTISVVALYNTDVVLVRHFLTEYEAGLYAALSVLGKFIFFGAAPITVTMFPLISEAHAKGERYQGIFIKSLIFLIAIAGSTTLVFSLAPVQSMQILIGSQYLDAAQYLSRFSIFLSLVALINLLIHFFLSIHRTKAVFVILFGAIVQAIALWVYHPDIASVVTISLAVSTVIAVTLSFYYLYVSRT